MTFTKVRIKKAFAFVAEQISEAVHVGEYSGGQMLPSEKELAKQFDVGRQIIREALSALQLAGVVETRAGLGSFVVGSGGPKVSAKIWSLAADESPSEVMEVRLVVEALAARLAAERLADDHRNRLGALLTQMRTAAAGAGIDYGKFGELDLKFHREIAAASENAVIARVVDAVTGYANQRLWRSIRAMAYQHEGLAQLYLQQHERTFECLEASDGTGAANSMLIHLEMARDVASGQYDSSTSDANIKS